MVDRAQKRIGIRSGLPAFAPLPGLDEDVANTRAVLYSGDGTLFAVAQEGRCVRSAAHADT